MRQATSLTNITTLVSIPIRLTSESSTVIVFESFLISSILVIISKLTCVISVGPALLVDVPRDKNITGEF